MGQAGFRVIRLAEGDRKTIRFLSDRIDNTALDGAAKPIVVNITRTGQFHDPRYGDFEITRDMLLSMVRNFDARVYGQDIALDVAHQPENGAAGYFRKLFLDGNKLRGEVELTDYGREAIGKRGYRYLSAEYADNYVDNEHRRAYGATLLAAGLTVRPVIKHLDRVDPKQIQLSEAALGKGPTLVSDRIRTYLSEDFAMFKQFLEALRKKLTELKLPDAIVKALTEAFTAVGESVEDKDTLTKLAESFERQGKSLAEQIEAAKTDGRGELKLDLSGIEKILGGGGEKKPAALTADDVKKILAEEREANAKTLAEAKQKLESNQKLFDDKLVAAKGLSEAVRKELADGRELVTGDMDEAQVTALAEQQIKLGEKLEAAKKLGALGYQVQGSTRIEAGASEGALRLQEQINEQLGRSTIRRQLSLTKEVSPFVERVLAEFDRHHAAAIDAEVRALAGDSGTMIGDTSLPAGFQRTVIREALSDLNILNIVQTLVDPTTAQTTNIPYEERDVSAIHNDGIVYEGGAIHRGSITQRNDVAWLVGMKIALLISNEAVFLSRNNRNIDWDAYARNVQSNARFMRELVCKRIANEMQRAADAYLALDIADENVGGQLDGATSTVKTAQFPVVRPCQARSMDGTAQGNPENPITVKLAGAAIAAFDGTGKQAAATYYRVTNYNLGYVQLVDQTGAPVTPAAGTALTISYSYATNIAKFDTDVANGETVGEHFDGLLRAFGARKAMLNGDRFINPDFALMSPVLNDQITNAESFVQSRKRAATDLNADGDLEEVKNVPAFGTNAPGIDLGDERIILGQRGTTAYVIAKPYQLGEPVEARNADGFLIGKKEAYGEEYNAIKTPTPIRNRFTSIIAYSATNR